MRKPARRPKDFPRWGDSCRWFELRVTTSEVDAILSLSYVRRVAIARQIAETFRAAEAVACRIDWAEVDPWKLVSLWWNSIGVLKAMTWWPYVSPTDQPTWPLFCYAAKLIELDRVSGQVGTASSFAQASTILAIRPYALAELNRRLHQHVGRHPALIRVYTATLKDQAAEQRLRPIIKAMVETPMGPDSGSPLMDAIETTGKIATTHLGAGLKDFFQQSAIADDPLRMASQPPRYAFAEQHFQILETVARAIKMDPLEVLVRATAGRFDIVPTRVADRLRNSYGKERRRRSREVPPDEAELGADNDADAVDTAVGKEIGRDRDRARETLSPRQRAVWDLHQAGHTLADIAELLKLSEGTVRGHYRDAKRRLKKFS